MENSKILIRNAAQIVTCHGDKARRGAEMSDLGVIEDGAVAMSDGVITHVGPTEEVLRNIHAEDYLEIRAENQAVLPGFVDSHTHFIFGGYREEEFSWRLRGDSYMSIMERGGGIVNTMKATRESDFDTLWDRGKNVWMSYLHGCYHSGREKWLWFGFANRISSASCHVGPE